MSLPVEVLAFEPMASGHRSLRLTTVVGWEGFQSYANAIVAALGGRVLDRVDSPIERVWTVEVDGGRFWLALDDYGLGVSLDSCDAQADARIDAVLLQLQRLAPGASEGKP